MYKHILVPTDGSELSNMAVRNAVPFAKAIGARITGLTVTEPFHVEETWSMHVNQTLEQYSEVSRLRAERNLGVLKEAASEAGVPCDLVHCIGPHPYEEIVRTATECGCDVIFQASHGRHGIGALLMGSETLKVLTHTKIPVLVFR